MINSIRSKILQNFRNLQKMSQATVAYQFKVERPVYYPNRESENLRISEQLKSQLVTEKQQEPRKLPKDYYYKILGVHRNATTQQVKTAYYSLAKLFHPDKSKASPESKRFQEISNAYHILTDESKRLEYDQLGIVKDEQSFLKKAAQPPLNRGESNVPMTKEELIKMTTGEPKLELSFLEAAHGVKKSVDLRFIKKCPTCSGKSPRLINRTNPELCRRCNGTGKITRKTPTYTSIVNCDHCQGRRYINRNECDTCDNRGIVLETARTTAVIPEGSRTGDAIVIENPKTKQRVKYSIQVQPSEHFDRIGNNVLSDKFITISEAVLGGTFKVRGIFEDLEVKVTPGTESHTRMVIKGKGFKGREGAGDHIVTLKVRIPRQLSMKQRQLILALSKTEDPTFERAG